MTEDDRRDTRLAVEAELLPPLFTAVAAAMVAIDRDGLVTALTATAEDLLGYAEGQLVGGPFHERLHGRRADGQPLPAADCPIIAALRDGRGSAGDDEVLERADGWLLPVSWAFAPTVVAREPAGGVLVFHDRSDNGPSDRRAQRRLATVERANARLRLLAEVTQIVSDAADVQHALSALSTVLVPRLADWVVIDVVDPDSGRLRRAALAHRDPAAQQAAAGELGVLPPLTDVEAGALACAVRSGQVQHVTRFPAPEAASGPLGAARLRLFHQLGACEAVTAPLRVRGRTVGAITVVRVDAGRPYSADDIATVEELAGRTAAVVDTGLLLEHSLATAEHLQRVLLPELPDRIGPVSLTGRYVPASQATRVGGDWYDAFSLPDDSIAVIVGDVAGHDQRAAARMGAVRHKLRGIAADRLAPPSEVLERLDAALQNFTDSDLITAVYARLVPQADGTWVFEWSSAGHLPPLVVDPDPRLLEGEPDQPLGIGRSRRHDHRVALSAPAAVVLYTDGLVERPSDSIDTGLQRLVTAAAGVPAGELADRLVDQVLLERRDDTALLVACLG